MMEIIDGEMVPQLLKPLLLYRPLIQAVMDIMIKGHKQAFLWMDEWFGKK